MSNKNNNNNNNNSLKSPINIIKINKISQSVKNDYIYINITNLIGDYDVIGNAPVSTGKSNIFTENLLLKTIVYILSPSGDSKNRIIYFIHTAKNGKTQKIFVYNTQNNEQYVRNITI